MNINTTYLNKNKNEIIRNFLLKIIYNNNIDNNIRMQAFYNLHTKLKKTNRYNKKNICIFTKKSIIYKISNSSRLIIKLFIESGLWTGTFKRN